MNTLSSEGIACPAGSNGVDSEVVWSTRDRGWGIYQVIQHWESLSKK